MVVIRRPDVKYDVGAQASKLGAGGSLVVFLSRCSFARSLALTGACHLSQPRTPNLQGPAVITARRPTAPSSTLSDETGALVDF